MSGHVVDRLGAYLDAELSAAEEAAVSGHLRECPGCSRHLEELQAVDQWARSLPAEPAPGYFDGLPGRVRNRLAPRPKRARGLPVWTLAAAAALLLAVVTPFTLKQIPPPGSPAAEVPRPVPGPPQPTPEAPLVARAPLETPAAAKPAPREHVSKREAESKIDKEVGAVVVEPAPRTIPVPRPGAAEGTGQSGVNAFQDPWDSLVNERRANEAAVRSRQADAAAAEPQAGSLELDGAAAGASSDARDAATPSEEAPAAPARSSFAAPPAAESSSGLAGLIGSGTEARYQALLARKAGMADEARALREAWRSLARDVAADPAGDEIRERAVEAAAEAYRISRDPRDLAELRRDAEAYLARADAQHGDQVRGLLREFEP